MSQSADQKSQSHPTVSEHPEQRRQEETGHEDASDPSEVGRPSSQTQQPKKPEHAA
jgi:hypothetical protein